MGVPVEKLRRDLNCIWIEFKLHNSNLKLFELNLNWIQITEFKFQNIWIEFELNLNSGLDQRLPKEFNSNTIQISSAIGTACTICKFQHWTFFMQNLIVRLVFYTNKFPLNIPLDVLIMNPPVSIMWYRVINNTSIKQFIYGWLLVCTDWKPVFTVIYSTCVPFVHSKTGLQTSFKGTELCDINSLMMVLLSPLHEMRARGGSLMTTFMEMLLT